MVFSNSAGRQSEIIHNRSIIDKGGEGGRERGGEGKRWEGGGRGGFNRILVRPL